MSENVVRHQSRPDGPFDVPEFPRLVDEVGIGRVLDGPADRGALSGDYDRAIANGEQSLEDDLGLNTRS